MKNEITSVQSKTMNNANGSTVSAITAEAIYIIKDRFNEFTINSNLFEEKGKVFKEWSKRRIGNKIAHEMYNTVSIKHTILIEKFANAAIAHENCINNSSKYRKENMEIEAELNKYSTMELNIIQRSRQESIKGSLKDNKHLIQQENDTNDELMIELEAIQKVLNDSNSVLDILQNREWDLKFMWTTVKLGAKAVWNVLSSAAHREWCGVKTFISNIGADPEKEVTSSMERIKNVAATTWRGVVSAYHWLNNAIKKATETVTNVTQNTVYSYDNWLPRAYSGPMTLMRTVISRQSPTFDRILAGVGLGLAYVTYGVTLAAVNFWFLPTAVAISSGFLAAYLVTSISAAGIPETQPAPAYAKA